MSQKVRENESEKWKSETSERVRRMIRAHERARILGSRESEGRTRMNRTNKTQDRQSKSDSDAHLNDIRKGVITEQRERKRP